MNRTIQIRLIIMALTATVLLVALTGLPGDVSPSVGQAVLPSDVTRAPRPHPISHVSFPPGIDLLNPRPHPVSHLGSALNRP